MLRGSDDQLIAQLILEPDEGDAICPGGAGGKGDLVGENLDERIRDRLMGAGVTDVDLQCNLWKRKSNTEQRLGHFNSHSAFKATGGGKRDVVRKSRSISKIHIILTGEIFLLTEISISHDFLFCSKPLTLTHFLFTPSCSHQQISEMKILSL